MSTRAETYAYRPLGWRDLSALARLHYTVSVAEGVPEALDPEDIRAALSSPGFSLEESTRVAETVDGTMVGSSIIFEHDVPVYPQINIDVHPDYTGEGIGDALLEWAERTAERVVDRCPADARIAYRTAVIQGYTPDEELMRAHGYAPIRYFVRMVIDMNESTPPAYPAAVSRVSSNAGVSSASEGTRFAADPGGDVRLPAGIELRNYEHPADLDRWVQVHEVCFSDHWGHVDEPFAEVRKRWKHRLESDRLFDPGLFFLAVDQETGRIAGYSYCRSEERGKPDSGYVATLGVHPDYRTRGLGRALLRQSFAELYRRGKRSVALHVDSASLTGATRLYEQAGMHTDYAFVVWEKLVREGKELART